MFDELSIRLHLKLHQCVEVTQIFVSLIILSQGIFMFSYCPHVFLENGHLLRKHH